MFFFSLMARGGANNERAYLRRTGTVPLAYHCASGWGGSRLNPSRVRVRLKEYEHEAADPLAALLRPLDALAGLGNDRDADHVTILGTKK